MFDCSDSELIFLARQGDKAAFSRLLLRYQPMAQRIAKQAIGNEDTARDIVQDAMLQAYLSLAKLNNPTSFKSWLYGIVLNLCRNELRRRRVIYFSLETMVETLVDEHHSIDRSTLDPQLIAEQEELHAAISDAMDNLSDRNRLATILFYHEQLTIQEVADRLNISVCAVKGRLHKARHQLRSILSPLQFPIQPTLVQEFSTMNTSTSTSVEPEICCSFCHKTKEKVDLLIAGPLLMSSRLYICNECVAICNDIIQVQVDRQNSI